MSQFAVPGLMPTTSPIYNGETGTEPLRIIRGITFHETWTIVVDAENGDLSGYGIRAQARRNPRDLEAAFDLAPTIFDPSAQIIYFDKTIAETLELPLGLFYTDVLLDLPDGTVEVLVENQLVTVEDLNTQTPEE